MSDDQLKDLVLDRLFADETVPDDVRMLVMAALESDDTLSSVLSEAASPREVSERLEAHVQPAAQPTGTFLRSLTVQGFRGIGEKVKVTISDGPGLVVIAGRNGSGKSSLARGPRDRPDRRQLTVGRQGRQQTVQLGVAKSACGCPAVGPAGRHRGRLGSGHHQHRVARPGRPGHRGGAHRGTARREARTGGRPRMVDRPGALPAVAQLRRARQHPRRQAARVLPAVVQAPRSRAVDRGDHASRRRGQASPGSREGVLRCEGVEQEGPRGHRRPAGPHAGQGDQPAHSADRHGQGSGRRGRRGRHPDRLAIGRRAGPSGAGPGDVRGR